MPGRHIVIGGREIPCGFDVWDGSVMGTWWTKRDAQARCRERTRDVRGIVVHYTAAENPPHAMYQNMTARRVSCHFAIDQMGVPTQFADPLETVTAHASKANGWTVGIENVSRGRFPPFQGHHRADYIDEVHGRSIRFLSLYPEQLEGNIRLVSFLATVLGIPFTFPRGADGRVKRGFLGDEALEKFAGILAHFHCSETKTDVDPRTMDALARSCAPVEIA
jgi:hypothetical protein